MANKPSEAPRQEGRKVVWELWRVLQRGVTGARRLILHLSLLTVNVSWAEFFLPPLEVQGLECVRDGGVFWAWR